MIMILVRSEIKKDAATASAIRITAAAMSPLLQELLLILILINMMCKSTQQRQADVIDICMLDLQLTLTVL